MSHCTGGRQPGQLCACGGQGTYVTALDPHGKPPAAGLRAFPRSGWENRGSELFLRELAAGKQLGQAENAGLAG